MVTQHLTLTLAVCMPPFKYLLHVGAASQSLSVKVPARTAHLSAISSVMRMIFLAASYTTKWNNTWGPSTIIMYMAIVQGPIWLAGAEDQGGSVGSKYTNVQDFMGMTAVTGQTVLLCLG